jgi:hypothetical protein
MIREHRENFNARFTPEKYQRFLNTLDDGCATHVKFRNCETPLFLPRPLFEKMSRYGVELIEQLLASDYLVRSDETIPPEFNVPNQSPRPLFIQVDFGLTADLKPKLVEIQAFPSLYAYQPFLQCAYKSAYELDQALDPSFDDEFRRAVLGDYSPENVVLLEIDPQHQKTLPDFLLTEKLTGIRTACITKIEKRGRKLYFEGRPLHRIYNRVIVDELVRRQIKTPFDYRDDLDVEWAGHPNWYFRISKFSIPFLKHDSVPKTHFLNEHIPDNLSDWVLKPLYSFAGFGVVIGPTREQIAAIADPSQYILQERIDFSPLVETPHGATKAEIRMMYIWPDGAEHPHAVSTIIRMGRGKMMGVDHNRDMEWVGASAAFIV